MRVCAEKNMSEPPIFSEIWCVNIYSNDFLYSPQNVIQILFFFRLHIWVQVWECISGYKINDGCVENVWKFLNSANNICQMAKVSCRQTLKIWRKKIRTKIFFSNFIFLIADERGLHFTFCSISSSSRQKKPKWTLCISSIWNGLTFIAYDSVSLTSLLSLLFSILVYYLFVLIYFWRKNKTK